MVCTRLMVSSKYAARAMSITSFFGWIGMGLGGFLGGYLFDLTGAYDYSYGFAAAAGAINLTVLIVFFARARSKRDNNQTQLALR